MKPTKFENNKLNKQFQIRSIAVQTKTMRTLSLSNGFRRSRFNHYSGVVDLEIRRRVTPSWQIPYTCALNLRHCLEPKHQINNIAFTSDMSQAHSASDERTT